ncbi:hypothetical protein APHAL10511_006805 [Amanita phalloides]|nr:hypothetical protein APHAL10511_006805 [Amanita phalloides]
MNFSSALLFFFLFVCFSSHTVRAFGAGNIPSFAYLEGTAFRHGDIEDALANLIKHSASGFALATLISKGTKFSRLDVKRVYFGNWLRDYSQAVDIAGLKKLQLQSIISLCMVLGFLAHGYATNEFEVTAERLGVYLPVEHIDNPKGYGEGEDARRYHPKLRGPVNPMELQIDPQTGMKNYIANEHGNWDTSKAHVRRVLQECVRYGRLYRSQGRKEDEYEAFRLLGTALHTLEDFSAHSNFCELALVSMGHKEVFMHVGNNVRLQAPNRTWVAPIVTGTFGSSDFTFSLLGEATDHLSEASVTDLNRELDKARARSQGTRGEPGFNPANVLRQLFASLPGGIGGTVSRDMENIERVRAGGGKRPEDMTPQELHSTLWQVLVFRDSVMKTISQTLEKIPGLSALVEKISDSVSVFVLTTIEPFVRPLMKNAKAGLTAASEEVINKGDQYQVFDDPRASDPTHSFLSKDHFNNILNEPAGEIAKAVVVHAVNLVTKAWDDESLNVREVTEDILSCLFHPDFHNPNSKVQRDMLQCMRVWTDGLGGRRQSILKRLSKEAVRNHQNVRGSGEGGPAASNSSFAAAEAHSVQQQFMSHAQNIPGLGSVASILTKGDNVNTGGSQYLTSATAETKYTPGYSGYNTESSSTYSYAAKPTQSHGPLSPYRVSSETPGYTPSYASSNLPSSRLPLEPSYPGIASAGPAVHHGHEGRQEPWLETGHEGHYRHHEDHRSHSYGHHEDHRSHSYGHHEHLHEHLHGESSGYAPGGFPEPVPGGAFAPAPDAGFGFPGAEPYRSSSYSSQEPRFPNPQQPDDSYQYGWRN